MKNYILTIVGVLLALPALAADNNIKMVTYFPVPYAAYADLAVTGTCDVGMLGNCQLDAGEKLYLAPSTSASGDLNTGSLILRQGKVNLDSSISDSRVVNSLLTVGTGVGVGELDFEHELRVSKFSNTSGFMEAQNRAYLDKLNLFGEAFPKCTSDTGSNQISWQRLNMDGTYGVFLVCGTGHERETTCEEDPNQEKCCTGENVFWNGTSCVRQCKESHFKDEQYNGWYGGRFVGYFEFLDGECPDMEVLASAAGVSPLECISNGYWKNRGTAAEEASLTCEQQSYQYGDEKDIVCVYAVPGYYGGCVAGVLTCELETNTWTCPSSQFCGATEGICE